MGYTKAEMLKYLKTNLPQLQILPMVIVQSDNYFRDKNGEILKILEAFPIYGKHSTDIMQEVIVRSSSRSEDTVEISNAGKFKSVLNVPLHSSELMEAIESVYDSYDTAESEEILIQPMLMYVKMSGVVFTADMETRAPYYIVNYSESADTEAVTGGKKQDLKTFICYKNASTSVPNRLLEKILQQCGVIESFLENHALDIEFAVTQNDEIYILQVRPLAKGSNKQFEIKDLRPSLKRIYKKVQKLSKPHPFLLGGTTCFGVMPDWNPAEILGIRPKKLAISLYKELITDNIWAHQRFNYGYRDLTSHPLMVSFCGIPYIDTRITFNSFIPAKLNEAIAEKLVNYYLKQLSVYPAYHDKIEFEIVFSCYYFGMPEKLKKLLKYGFNENELKRIEYALLELTNDIINPETGLYKSDIEKAKLLESNYNKIIISEISLVDKIYWLIEECKIYGTLPFAGVARSAFIAIQFLRSFVDVGLLQEESVEIFMNSLHTINRQMAEDLQYVLNNDMYKKDFIKKYGHVRPGTYDILSPRYDEDFNHYFSEINLNGDVFDSCRQRGEIFTAEIKDKMQIAIEQNGLQTTAEGLIEFMRKSIEGREYTKFIFTKAVSKILQLIEELGNRVGINREDMAHLDISYIKQLYSDLFYGEILDVFKENISNNKKQYAIAEQLKLPSIIIAPEDIYSFHLLYEEPNFITNKKAIAAAAVLEKNDKEDIKGKIVFVPSADPGYDFIFAKGIKGLITQFGGANSHMAIRCAELGIPAVIGAGEKNFKEWQKAKFIELDCMKKQVIMHGFFEEKII